MTGRFVSAYYVQVRVRRGGGSIRLTSSRWIQEHGLFGRLHMVRACQALQLLDRGIVSLRPGMSASRLREQVAAEAARAAAA
jgi:hypothetical protein